MTNQASEDELTKALLGFKGGYGRHSLSSIQSLIRTEKLKLLAEVRERVVGEDTPGLTNIMIAAEHAKQLAALTKLEAEL